MVCTFACSIAFAALLAYVSYDDMVVDASTKNKLAVLVMAQASGRQVKLEIDDASCGDYSHPVASYVAILR